MSQTQRENLKSLTNVMVIVAMGLISFFSAQTYFDIKSSIKEQGNEIKETIKQQNDQFKKLGDDVHAIKERIIRLETKIEK